MDYTKEQIVAIAERYLAPHQSPDYQMRVLDVGVQKIGDTDRAFAREDRARFPIVPKAGGNFALRSPPQDRQVDLITH